MPLFVTSDGSTINYGDIGCGPPILFIHGWMMSGSVWEYQYPLSESYRVITPDLRGHGKSDSSFFSYDACRNDLVELLDHLALENPILVGWSMGAQILLYSWPKLMKRSAAMVLVSGTPHFCAEGEYEHGVSFAQVRTLRTRLIRSFAWAAGEFVKSMFAPGELEQSRCLQITSQLTARLPSSSVALSALDALIHTDLRNELQNISTPTLLLHGNADIICPSSASCFMSKKLGAAQVKIFEGSGHAPFLARDVEFNGIIQKFAQEVYGSRD